MKYTYQYVLGLKSNYNFKQFFFFIHPEIEIFFFVINILNYYLPACRCNSRLVTIPKPLGICNKHR